MYIVLAFKNIIPFYNFIVLKKENEINFRSFFLKVLDKYENKYYNNIIIQSSL
jgi:hypothetical protein